MAIGDQLEGAMLRKDCGFVVDGTIFEPEERFRRDPVAMDDLSDVSGSDDEAVFRTQFEKAVKGPLRMADRYRIRLGAHLPGADQHGDA